MKKFLLVVVMLVSLLVIGTGCVKSESSNTFDKVEGNISYQTLSSIKLLEAKEQFSRVQKMSQSEDAVEVTEQEEVQKYLNLMEEFIATDGGMKTEVKESDKPEYANYIRITTKDLQGNEASYDLYYNQELIKEEDEDKDEDKDESNEVEEEYSVTGICISNDVVYQLEGKIEKEQDKDEVENESYFKIIQDKDNYIVVKEEFEQEENEYEHEFKYEIVANGKKVETVSFELEEEDGKLSIEVKESKNGFKRSYRFKEHKEGQNKFIKIQVKEGKEVKNIIVRAVLNTETNEYEYNYQYAK